MKPLLILSFLLMSMHSSFSQSDILVLKKRNQAVQTWLAGSYITFQFSSKQWIEGIIKKIYKDSLLIEQFRIERRMSNAGFAILDTAKFGLMKLHIDEIYGVPRRDHADIFTNGAILQLGGGAYILLNLVNSLRNSDPLFSSANAARLGIAGAVLLTGILLSTSHKNFIALSDKYKMATIQVQ